MILKENIKAKVDKLDNYELRVVELVIDSLRRKNPAIEKKTISSKKHPYQQVIKLMKNHQLTSNDINLGREDRL
ncbi:hypothetical protein [Mariniphaga sp.]|jgi:hypothetical protein|uniref:hypothetical protein n=1 Tax=Mariniphaga sp. TaxID=1954475 RepID=UPI0035695457